MKLPLKGVIAPKITPLVDNKNIDIQGLENLVEHLVEGVVHGLFILGTKGDAPSLTNELRKEFIKRNCELVDANMFPKLFVEDKQKIEQYISEMTALGIK